MHAATLLCFVPLLFGQAPAAGSTVSSPSAPAPQAQPAPMPLPPPAPEVSRAPPTPASDAAARNDDRLRAAEQQARNAEQQAGAAEQQARDAKQRAAQLEAEMAAIRAEMERERQRAAALEQQLAAERARKEEEARAPAARDAALGAATQTLSNADAALTGGSSDISDALVEAQALASEVAKSAATTGSPQESAYAYETQRLLGVSQEALQRGDLFQARQALEAAGRAATQARGLAAAAGGTGAAAANPSSY